MHHLNSVEGGGNTENHDLEWDSRNLSMQVPIVITRQIALPQSSTFIQVCVCGIMSIPLTCGILLRSSPSSRLRKNSCVLGSLRVERQNSLATTPREVQDAWAGYPTGRDVQLSFAGGASPGDPSAAAIRQYVDTALTALSPQLERLYARTGRPSIAPEKLLRALLLQVLYSLRSERLLMEELQYNLLFRWFVGLDLDASVWDVTVFTKNRDRLLAGAVATAFFKQVLAQAKAQRLLSDEHFTVDGTLIEAWAGQKSFKKTASAPPSTDDTGNRSVDFRGERRTNATHASTTDPEARLYKKATGQEAKLCFLGHVLMENRHGLVVNTRLAPAIGTAEREAGRFDAEGQTAWHPASRLALHLGGGSL